MLIKKFPHIEKFTGKAILFQERDKEELVIRVTWNSEWCIKYDDGLLVSPLHLVVTEQQGHIQGN